MINMRIINVWRVLSPKWNIHVTCLSPKAEKIVVLKELERWQEPEATRTIIKILSSKHGSVILFMNSEQLWFSTQDLHKIKPVHTPPFMPGRWAFQTPLLTQQVLTVPVKREPMILRVCPLISYLWWSLRHEYIGSPQWTQCFRWNKIKK